MFFDTTSIYFERAGSESLGQYGPSFDHRPDLKQIVMGVVIDGDGYPICCELWSSNTTDVRTLVPIIERLRRRFAIGEEGLVHHSDRGVQYVSIRYTERLAEVGIELSVGSIGDFYDNALAESIIGLFKIEVIRKRGPWRHLQDVEFATLEWVDWFNHRRLFEPIGDILPAEFEEVYYRQSEESAMTA